VQDLRTANLFRLLHLTGRAKDLELAEETGRWH
jgi:hypothetical protein